MQKGGENFSFDGRSKNQRFLHCNFFSKNHKGQITIFIIVGLLIVAGIALFFLFRTEIASKIGGKSETNFNSIMSTCIESKARQVSRELALNGGYPNDKLSINFLFTEEGNYKNITYLCYTQNNYKPCINQHPALLLDLQKGIENGISSDVRECFDEMVSSLKSQNFEVNQKYNGFDVELNPKKIAINVDAELALRKSGETSTQENFKASVSSRLYEIAGVAQEILNQESTFCYFEETGFALAYPDFTLDTFNFASESTKIYTIKQKDSDEKFRFAVRGCNIPPGFA